MTPSASEPSGNLARPYCSSELSSRGNPNSGPSSNSDSKRHLDKDLPTIPSFDVNTSHAGFELDTTVFTREKSPTRDGSSQQAPNSKLKLSITRSKTGLLTDRRESCLTSFKDDAAKDTKPRPGSQSDNNVTLRPPEPKSRERGLRLTESSANFARSSWISRTLSRKSQLQSPVGRKFKPEKISKPSKLQPTQDKADVEPKEDPAASATQKALSKLPSRAGTYFAKIMPKQLQPVQLATAQDDTDSDTSSATNVGHAGPQGITSCTSQSTSSENNSTPITDGSSNEMPPRMRDTLWSSFNTLELAFKSFTFKEMAQRIVRIQSLLLPFLRSTMNHPSIRVLQPEDVDRRATILHKWWNAILNLLGGQSQQPVPGVDRPSLFEAATMLMMRPEWRRTTSYFQPLAERSPSERVPSRSGTNSSQSSFDSNQSILLAKSAEHNVRTMFVANLVRQMAVVVEKMSLRHAPLALVNFAGKTCAYAFFFAPGVADILLRLWGLTPELIRRVADEFGLPRKDNGDNDDIVAFFPPALGAYGWTSPRAVWNNMKRIPKMTVLIARIPWTGPWVARWKGRDTDLFFIFCKYFHVLSDQFMPPGLPITQRARSPAFVLVQAQLLSLLDSTIHRQAALGHAYNPPLVEFPHGADASALTMQLPPSNLLKGMSENRLVVLLRNFLTDEASGNGGEKETFGAAFAALMKAATRRTSKFDNAACFTLCDFLEEVFVIYDNFTTSRSASSYIDWSFWVEVFRRIMSSMNTMSEVRTLSFLFTVWNVAAKDPQAKSELCADWLLTEETFNSLFNNWCPMVRAYYHRLLCWRMCLYDEKVTDADVTPASSEQSTGYFNGAALPKASSKKRWSLLGTVLSPTPGTRDTPRQTCPPRNHSFEDSLRLDRREVANNRSPQVSQGLGQTQKMFPPSHSSVAPGGKSAPSLPIIERQKYVFKFSLSWQQQNAPNREQSLFTPQLPRHAQDRVGGSNVGVSRPHLSDGFVSVFESSRSGLVQRAKNANPLASPMEGRTRRLSLGESITTDGVFDGESTDMAAASVSGRSDANRTATPNAYLAEDTTQPIKPAGVYVRNVVYSGPSLAEWTQVVSEHNCFVDRRQDGGISRLCDMEVPMLGVEAFCKLDR